MDSRNNMGGVTNSNTADANGYSVLIVDDNRELLQLLTDALEQLGQFRVVTALDGIEGLEKYFEMRPDCMVIDIMMPGLDGFQLVKALRGDPDSAQTPLIFLTALAQDRDRVTGFISGIDQYLVKPVRPQELITAVQQAIRAGDTGRRQRLQALMEQDIPEG
jgi:DNA-binding response OmpR family regulator